MPVKQSLPILLWLLVVLNGAFGAPPRFDETELARIPERMEQFVREGKIAGAVTLVATTDEIVHLAAVGKADLATGREMRPDSIFRIASMTKPITATALMMLVEQGKLQVDDPVAKYIPSFAALKLKDGTSVRPPVTIRDILTHTAGLAQPPRTDGDTPSLAELCEAIAQQPLAFEPGSRWQYSSGLTVAGRLIEVASGKNYEDFLQHHLFDPLGMKDSGFVLAGGQRDRLAVTYEPGQGASLQAVAIPDPTVRRTPNPSGGLFSTASDMARFYQAVLGGGARGEVRILSSQLVGEMTRNHTPGIVTGFTPGNAWGLGWCRVERPQGVTRHLFPGTYGHGGAWGTQGWVDPQRGLIFVLMIQRSGFGNSDASEVRDAFTELAVLAHRGAETANARFVDDHGFHNLVELKRDDVRVVLCPQVGGRPLEFSVAGKNGLYLDPQEGSSPPPKPLPVSAGRFDFGPELITPSHPRIWSGAWSAEITGESSARLASQHDVGTGVQLLRDFELGRGDEPSTRGDRARDTNRPWRLACRQTIVNVSDQVREYCHWGRSFSPGGGICLIPLAGRSRFPGGYALYEDSALINVRAQDEQIRQRDGFLEILAPPRKPKLGFDSYAGWLAYLMPDNRLFVKRFPTFPDRVYNEAAGLTISVWYPPGPRIELEPIGPRERLEPGQAASFTEEWWLLDFPFPPKGEVIDLAKLRSHVATQTGAGS